MNPTRVTILLAAGLTMAACGAPSTAINSAAGRSVANPTARPDQAVPAAAPVAAALSTSPPPVVQGAATTPAPARPAPSAVPAPPPAPQLVVTASEADYSASSIAVRLVTTQGRVVASTTVANDARWTVSAGAGGAYWVTAGKLQRLAPGGVVTTVAAMPSTESGRVAISPDGTQWGYATMSPGAAGVTINRLYRAGVNLQPRLIAERTSDPQHPTADAPVSWQYYVYTWDANGILVERQPTGGCGCGTPFDMEMTAGFSAYINPLTGVATPITGSDACPLSGASADGTAACFHRTADGASDSLVLARGGHATSHFALTGKTDGGAAVFDRSSLAYATTPSGAGGCGGPDWRPVATLRIMDTAAGTTRAVGPLGLTPSAWLNDHTVLATLHRAGATGADTTSSVVTVNPATGRVTTLLAQTTLVIGIA